MSHDELLKRLDNNLRVLKTRSENLYACLSLIDVNDCLDRLIRTRDSNYTSKVTVNGSEKFINSSYNPWGEAEKLAQATLAKRPNSERGAIHYFFAGFGYHLKRLFDLGDMKLRVILYEKEPEWLVAACMLHDFSKHISDGRLEIFIEGVEPWRTLAIGDEDITWVHPVLGKMYAHWLNGLIGKFVTQSEIGDRALIININTHGAYINLSKAVGQTLESMGYKTASCSMSMQQIRDSVLAIKPAFLFSLSFSSELAGLAGDIDTPYLCWEIDKVTNSSYINPQSLSSLVNVFTTYFDDVKKFTDAGAKAFYLPAAQSVLAADGFTLTPEEEKQYSSDISFVGSPLISINNNYRQLVDDLHAVMQDNRQSQLMLDAEKLLKAVNNTVERQKAFTVKNEYKLTEILQEEIKECRVKNLFSLSFEALGNHIAKECCMFQRQHYLKTLTPLSVDVYGNDDWLKVKSDNIRYRGEASFDSESVKIYRASKINIDLTRIYQLDGFSDRVFNVLWAGGFLMMNRTKTIERSFQPGRDLVVFDSAEEMKKLCEYYLAHPIEKEDIARRGRECLMKEHTVTSRVKSILSMALGVQASPDIA